MEIDVTQHYQLTAERLRHVLEYSPNTGEWVWLVTLSSRGQKGAKAGCPSIRDGWVIRIDGCLYKSHHLAWLYMTGEWPVDQIDHEDLDRTNNRWLNLREADNSQNGANKPLQCNNTSGFKNVSYRPDCRNRPYLAFASVSGKRKYLGAFKTAEEASSVAFAAAKVIFGEFARAA